MKFTKQVAALAVALGLVAGLAACSSTGTGSSTGSTESSPAGPAKKIVVVAAENEYGDVAQSIGGNAVAVTSIIDNPTADPHDFAATPKVAQSLASAQVVLMNGAGYDDWMNDLLKGTNVADRVTLNAQKIIGAADDVKNPHLWYDPKTMPAVATQLASELTKLAPSEKATFNSNLAKFKQDMTRYTTTINDFKSAHPNFPVAATEPVANYMLDAAGADIKTPWSLQAAIMNGQDPSAQDSATQKALFTGNKVKAFVYNEQVTSSLTKSYLKYADENKVPVVAVYETMPLGSHYVDWVVNEVTALNKAATDGTSTKKL